MDQLSDIFEFNMHNTKTMENFVNNKMPNYCDVQRIKLKIHAFEKLISININSSHS